MSEAAVEQPAEDNIIVLLPGKNVVPKPEHEASPSIGPESEGPEPEEHELEDDSEYSKTWEQVADGIFR